MTIAPISPYSGSAAAGTASRAVRMPASGGEETPPSMFGRVLGALADETANPPASTGGRGRTENANAAASDSGGLPGSGDEANTEPGLEINGAKLSDATSDAPGHRIDPTMLPASHDARSEAGNDEAEAGLSLAGDATRQSLDIALPVPAGSGAAPSAVDDAAVSGTASTSRPATDAGSPVRAGSPVTAPPSTGEEPDRVRVPGSDILSASAERRRADSPALLDGQRAKTPSGEAPGAAPARSNAAFATRSAAPDTGASTPSTPPVVLDLASRVSTNAMGLASSMTPTSTMDLDVAGAGTTAPHVSGVGVAGKEPPSVSVDLQNRAAGEGSKPSLNQSSGSVQPVSVSGGLVQDEAGVPTSRMVGGEITGDGVERVAAVTAKSVLTGQPVQSGLAASFFATPTNPIYDHLAGKSLKASQGAAPTGSSDAVARTGGTMVPDQLRISVEPAPMTVSGLSDQSQGGVRVSADALTGGDVATDPATARTDPPFAKSAQGEPAILPRADAQSGAATRAMPIAGQAAVAANAQSGTIIPVQGLSAVEQAPPGGDIHATSQASESGAREPSAAGASSATQQISASQAATPPAAGTTPPRVGVSAAALTFVTAVSDGALTAETGWPGFDGIEVFGGRGDGVMQSGAAARSLQALPMSAPQQTAATAHLAAEVARFSSKGATKFQIRMDPAELGRVDVELKISGDGSVRAHLAVERTETLDMLMRDQRGLERALDAAGLKLESGSVQLSLRDQGGFSGFAGSDTSTGSGVSGGETDEMTSEADGETAMVSRVQVTGSRGALDIQI